MLAQIARAVLYEGYLLWPYRRSAIKNQQRWTFGGVYPSAYARVSGGADRSVICADVLFEPNADDATIEVSLRFLQVVSRQAVTIGEGGKRTPVPELIVGSMRHLSWDEATERTTTVSCAALPGESARVDVQLPADEQEELRRDADGRVVGAIVRSWRAIDATMTVDIASTSAADRAPLRVTVTVTNDAVWRGDAGARDDAVRNTLVSAHIALRSEHGSFVSTEDAPAELRDVTASLRSAGLWPTLVGLPGERHTLLASPIILGDYPRIAPESPGDLFDGGEIDQLLILNILTLSDEEQAEMRDTDPRAREILDRCRQLGPEALMRLHATVRADRFDEPAPFPLDTEIAHERHLG
jgi:hypothetical protein